MFIIYNLNTLFIYNLKIDYSKRFKTSLKNGQPRIWQNNLPNFWTITAETILLHLAENVKIDYSKHPRKMTNQEFRKTACTTFGPFFIKSSATLKSNYSKYPRKMANQEFGKTASPSFGPFFEYFHRFSNPQHNGNNISVSTHMPQIIKVWVRKIGRADAE